MAYDLNHLLTLAEAKQIAQVFKVESDKAIKYIAAVGNTMSFFTTEDGSGTAAFTIDFPTEIFLDQARTTLVHDFKFEATKYPGATNPSLDGKAVFVFAVKGTTDPQHGTADDTINYSFLDVSALVDTYTVKEGISRNILKISGYEIEFKISEAENNAIKVKDDGLHVDISGKSDKVTGATADNLATLDANGNLTDSGVAKANVLQKSNVATTAEVTEMLSEVFGTQA